MSRFIRRLSLVLSLICVIAPARGFEYRGEASLEARHFAESATLNTGDSRQHSAIQLSAEFWRGANRGRDLFAFSPYLRLDARDSQRNLADIRELSWIHLGESYELRTGIRQVYWGVTEGADLVNIINQTDAADSPNTDRTLGQPMINLALEQGDQMLDLFLLIGARERTFPGEDGRLRFPLVVDSDQSRWESSRGQGSIDLAARWQWNHYPLVLGVSAFSGTAREPEFELGDSGARPVLTPFYPQIQQLGLDLQATQGDLLWKLEAIQRWGGREDFQAINAGFEYTQVGLFGSRMDLGWLSEGLYDSRGGTVIAPFERDLLLGWRFVFNDLAGSEILASAIVDTRTAERVISVEGRRRLGNAWSVSAEILYIGGTPAPQSPTAFLSNPDSRHTLRPLSRDSYGEIEFSWFF